MSVLRVYFHLRRACLHQYMYNPYSTLYCCARACYRTLTPIIELLMWFSLYMNSRTLYCFVSGDSILQKQSLYGASSRIKSAYYMTICDVRCRAGCMLGDGGANAESGAHLSYRAVFYRRVEIAQRPIVLCSSAAYRTRPLYNTCRRRFFLYTYTQIWWWAWLRFART